MNIERDYISDELKKNGAIIDVNFYRRQPLPIARVNNYVTDGEVCSYISSCPLGDLLELGLGMVAFAAQSGTQTALRNVRYCPTANIAPFTLS